MENKKLTKFRHIAEIIFLGLTVIGFLITIYLSFKNLEFPKYVSIILILPFILFLTPYLFLVLYNIKKVDSKMAVIPRFLRDIVDSVESGRDLITSIIQASNNEYGVLNNNVKKFSNQLSWGIDFEKAFLNFAHSVGSSDLIRDFSLVNEARKIGGHVEKILSELSEKISIENLRKKERKSNLASNTFTGYISFIIFIFIIIIVYNSLFVGISESFSQVEGTSSNSSTNSSDSQIKIYLSLFIMLGYELSILSGFLFGLMQENNIITGAPHVVMLMLMTFFSFFFFIHF